MTVVCVVLSEGESVSHRVINHITWETTDIVLGGKQAALKHLPM